MSRRFNELTEQYQRMIVKDILTACTPEQQALAAKIHPDGIPASALRSMYSLAERTLIVNRIKQDAEADKMMAAAIAEQLCAAGLQCNCDLDNWEPEELTGHSHVCRIHKAIIERLSQR